MHTSARAVVAAFALLLVAAFAIVPGTARANMDRPTWAAGDFWVYTAGNASLQSTLRISVTGTQSVMVNGTSYATYHTTTDYTSHSGSITVTYSADVWFSVDTLAIVEIQASINITGVISITISGNPPQTIQWPLTTNARWSSSTVVTVETAFPNGTKTYAYQALSTDFEVEPETTITVPKGTFVTTPLKETDTANATYTLNYWSPQVGNWARIGEYDSSGRNQGNFNLTDYSYQSGSFFTSVVFGLPVWIWLVLLVVILVAIIGVFAVRRRRPPTTMPSTMPPQMPPMEPPMGPEGPPPGSMP
jgi:hypothetical protein